MSGKRAKEVRRALRMYEGIAQDVDRLNMQVPYLDKRIDRAEQRLERRIRSERSQRRSESRVARWALGVAVVDLIAMAAMAVVLL